LVKDGKLLSLLTPFTRMPMALISLGIFSLKKNLDYNDLKQPKIAKVE
jgi:hypothetical protein